MKVEVKLRDPKFNAVFESKLSHSPNDYGNGYYMSITRNGVDWMYIDCRYVIGFNEKKMFFDTLREYFGENLVRIKLLEGNNGNNA